MMVPPQKIIHAKEKLEDYEKTPFPQKISKIKQFIEAFKELDKCIQEHPDNNQISEIAQNLKKTYIRITIKQIQTYNTNKIDFLGWFDLMRIFVMEKDITQEVLHEMKSEQPDVIDYYQDFVFLFSDEYVKIWCINKLKKMRNIRDMQNVLTEIITQIDIIRSNM